MTLFELLVVLTILAILSTVAVVSTETVISRGRFEATERTLQAIEEAILGPAPYLAEDGALATSGFVADMGRLPRDLSELWERGEPPDDLLEFGYWVADDDGEVTVPSGWRGPYLRLPFGAQGVRDGWGKEFELTLEYNSLDSIVVEKFMVRSDGPDGPPGNPDAIPQELVIVDQAEGIDRAHATVQVTVWQEGENGELEVPSGTGELIVQLFGREEGIVQSFFPTDEEGNPTAPTALAHLTSAPLFHFYHVPIGPHVLRAYVYPEGSQGSDSLRKSDPLQVHVHPLRSTSWKLVLPPDATGDAGPGTDSGDENDDNPEED